MSADYTERAQKVLDDVNAFWRAGNPQPECHAYELKQWTEALREVAKLKMPSEDRIREASREWMKSQLVIKAEYAPFGEIMWLRGVEWLTRELGLQDE